MRVSLLLRDFRASSCRLLIWLFLALALATQATAKGGEQLVVFMHPAATSPLAERFANEHLPAIRRVAEDMDVELRIVVVTQGAPAEVAITPLLVHQSARGRSFFQGRYPDIGKLTNFIRTSRALPLTGEAESRDQIATLELGRSRVATPIKITPLGGNLPPGVSAEAFEVQARTAIVQSFRLLKLQRDVRLGPADRKFYFDFHPYVAHGRFNLSLALFSQFHCIDSIFERFEQPLEGSWDERIKVLAEAARILEDEMLRHIANSEIGDGFDAVAQNTPQVSWQDLDLSLPEASQADIAVPTDLELPTRWRIRALDPGQPPRLSFRFPAPLERYAGEVTQVTGHLSLADDGSLHGANGWVEAAAASVTMGETGLDRAIHKKMIGVSEFPVARFDLENLVADSRPLAFGQTMALAAKGAFTLRGLKIPIEVKGDIEPIVNEDFEPLLRVRASFSIRLLDPFGLKGPDGPEPAKDTLVFYLDFLMEEEAEAS